MRTATRTPADVVCLSAGGVSVVLDIADAAPPAIVYWGEDLGPTTVDDLEVLRRHAVAPRVADGVDVGIRLGVLPEPARGWYGRPGIEGHRDGTASTQRFHLVDHRRSDSSWTGVLGADTGLTVRLEIELTDEGLLRQRASVRNSATTRYHLNAVTLSAPVPPHASEVLDLTGSHMRERHPQRAHWDIGQRVHESRRGRPGLQSTTFIAVGEPGFSFASGEVWCVHVAWSGNNRMLAEHTSAGHKHLMGGELLLPGEVLLEPSQEYVSPWIFFAWGRGLDDLSRRFHGWLRRRPGRSRRPRPVTVNTWEAVYFDHDLARLVELATLAAAAGAERFVLDDGWFRGRRDDRSGLGDWFVSERVWPQGLAPLVSAVHDAGMEFGLWVEPEMVSPDSELFRAHPEWAMGAPGRVSQLQRHQLVLDLTNPQAYEFVSSRLRALLDEYEIAYLKWDHNRDLLEAVEPVHGSARAREQTLALYRMLDELRRDHPALEIESCASGGGRVDLEILERTDRVWGSDSMDPIERLTIQRWTGILVPPELIGCHIGKAPSFDTERIASVDFRAITAIFGHLGIELDLAALSPAERIAEWVHYGRSIRDLLATGTVVRLDDPDPSRICHGVVAADRTRAVFSFSSVAVSRWQPEPPVTVRGLDPALHYRVRLAAPLRTQHADSPLADGVVASGAVLRNRGFAIPRLAPAQAIVVELDACT